jgi:hypothetical protein
MAAWIPDTLATSRCLPGSMIVDAVQAAFRVTVPPVDVT